MKKDEITKLFMAKAFNKLIDIVIDPMPILKFLKTKDNNKTIRKIVDSLSLEELNELWSILKVSKYSEDPKNIMEELKANLKSC